MIFLIFYFSGIIIVAKIFNAISNYWPEEEGNWAIITHEAYFPGFSTKKEAREYIKKKEWKTAWVVKL